MSYDRALKHHVVRCLHRDLELAPGVVEDQGDAVGFVMLEQPCWVDLRNPAAARVWTIAARDVKPSLQVLREVNAWNARVHRAKVWVDDDRDVIVAAEVRTESLEEGELGDVVASVVDCARRLGPVVDVVFSRPAAAPSTEEVDR